MIPTKFNKVHMPRALLSICETYEVRYHFFTEQPQIEKAYFTYPSMKHCMNRTQETDLQPRRSSKCEMGWKENATGLFDPNDVLDGQLNINWKALVKYPICVKKIEYQVKSSAGRDEGWITNVEDSNHQGTITTDQYVIQLSNINQCQSTYLSVKVTEDVTNLEETVDKVIDPVKTFFIQNKSRVITYNEAEKYDLTLGMFKNDKLKQFCLEAVDVFIDEGQKQRTVEKDEIKNALISTDDPCNDTNVTLLYRFKGSTTVSVDMVIQAKPNCTSASPISQTVLMGAIGGGIGAIILLTTVVATILIRRRKKPEAPKTDTDDNPIYGTYSRGSMDEGDYGDGDIVEAVDINDYYGT